MFTIFKKNGSHYIGCDELSLFPGYYVDRFGKLDDFNESKHCLNYQGIIEALHCMKKNRGQDLLVSYIGTPIVVDDAICYFHSFLISETGNAFIHSDYNIVFIQKGCTGRGNITARPIIGEFGDKILSRKKGWVQLDIEDNKMPFEDFYDKSLLYINSEEHTFGRAEALSLFNEEARCYIIYLHSPAEHRYLVNSGELKNKSVIINESNKSLIFNRYFPQV